MECHGNRSPSKERHLMSVPPKPLPPAPSGSGADLAALDWRGRARHGAFIGVLLNVYWTLPLTVVAVVYPSYFTRRLDASVTRWEAILGQAGGLIAVCVVAMLLLPHLSTGWRWLVWSPLLGLAALAPFGVWLLATRQVTQEDVVIYLAAAVMGAFTLTLLWVLFGRDDAAEARHQPPPPAL